MSYLLCRPENVRRPYYAETLGIHLYSSQELSYVIFNHPLLVMEDFIDDELLEFLREELKLGFLALKIERCLAGGGNPDDALVMILSECDYYSPAEIGRYRKLLANFRSRHPADYKKSKADELFFMKQYGRAAELYRELLEFPKDRVVDDVFVGKVWNNLGSCYARMFRMDLAMDAFEKAYLRTGQKRILEQMVTLTVLRPELTLSDRLQALVDEDMRTQVQERVREAGEHAREAPRVQELQNLFEKDLLKRQAGETELLARWRQEYRQIQ